VYIGKSLFQFYDIRQLSSCFVDIRGTEQGRQIYHVLEIRGKDLENKEMNILNTIGYDNIE